MWLVARVAAAWPKGEVRLKIILLAWGQSPLIVSDHVGAFLRLSRLFDLDVGDRFQPQPFCGHRLPMRPAREGLPCARRHDAYRERPYVSLPDESSAPYNFA